MNVKKIRKFGKAWVKALGITFLVFGSIAAVIGAIVGIILVAVSYGGEVAGFGAGAAMMILALTAMAAADAV